MDTRVKRGRRWTTRVMLWVRRIHLYSGLFMFPWVLLYGVTALLFNHPGVFPDQPVHTLARSDFVRTALEELVDPSHDAAQVVAALNDKFDSPSRSAPRFRLHDPAKAVYSKDVIVVRARGAGTEHSVLIDLPSGTAFVSSSDQTDAEQPPFALRGLKVNGSLVERVKTALPEALTRKGLAADDASVAIGAELLFFIEADGRVWRVSYHPQTGAVSGRLANDVANDTSTRKLLTQLHLTHGYPSRAGAKWMWALIVDFMFVSMVFWGISGLLMWWQIKNVRRIGAAILIASVILAAFLAVSMHGVLAPL